MTTNVRFTDGPERREYDPDSAPNTFSPSAQSQTFQASSSQGTGSFRLPTSSNPYISDQPTTSATGFGAGHRRAVGLRPTTMGTSRERILSRGSGRSAPVNVTNTSSSTDVRRGNRSVFDYVPFRASNEGLSEDGTEYRFSVDKKTGKVTCHVMVGIGEVNMTVDAIDGSGKKMKIYIPPAGQHEWATDMADEWRDGTGLASLTAKDLISCQSVLLDTVREIAPRMDERTALQTSMLATELYYTGSWSPSSPPTCEDFISTAYDELKRYESSHIQASRTRRAIQTQQPATPTQPTTLTSTPTQQTTTNAGTTANSGMGAGTLDPKLHTLVNKFVRQRTARQSTQGSTAASGTGPELSKAAVEEVLHDFLSMLSAPSTVQPTATQTQASMPDSSLTGISTNRPSQASAVSA